ncbi:MAG: hypothetical protein OEW39_15295, partial [Deltaproteobacteria bacterium]|nr:hypothetical protein [Deltaproteobacteria bacterium]
IKPRVAIEAVVAAPAALQSLIRAEQTIVETLAGLGKITLTEHFSGREGYGHGVGDGYEVFLSLAGAVDASAERQRLGREMERTRTRLEQLAAKLENPAFIGKAPDSVVAKNREELSALQAQLSKLTQSLNQLPEG